MASQSDTTAAPDISDMPFRFLDLAAELRNNIYEYALYHDRDAERLATVGLLRVCKQIHSEAKGILHEQLDAFTIRAEADDPFDSPRELELTGDIGASLAAEDATPLNLYDLLPRAMLHAREIRLHLSFVQYGPVEHFDRCRGNRPWTSGMMVFLYAFAHLLNSDGAKRRVVLSLHGESGYRDEGTNLFRRFELDDMLLATLAQLHTLQPQVELEYGGVAEEFKNGLPSPTRDSLGLIAAAVNPIETFKNCAAELRKMHGTTRLHKKGEFFAERLEDFLESPEIHGKDPILFFLGRQMSMEFLAIGLQAAAIVATEDEDGEDLFGRARECLKRSIHIGNVIVPHEEYSLNDLDDSRRTILGDMCELLGMQMKELISTPK